MAKTPALQIHPGQGLGFIALGSSLHNVLTRLKSQPDVFPKIDIYYSPMTPLSSPVLLDLPSNGFRLRFDGPAQKLRLIEVLDFTRTSFTYEGKEVVKIGEVNGAMKGPAFRHIYDRLIGPTFPGEYVPPPIDSGSQLGSYILSYPGVAFTFPLQKSAWSEGHDFVSLLSSAAAGAAKSMAIFDGASWQDSRQGLYTRECPNPRSFTNPGRGKDLRPDEIESVLVNSDGTLDFRRAYAPSFRMVLGTTTPQDLVTEFGPPDAIHRKSDRRLSIHKAQQRRHSRAMSPNYDSTDTDQSSRAITDDSDGQDDASAINMSNADSSAECFYNYFHHGFDIFVSHPSPPPERMTTSQERTKSMTSGEAGQLVATKVLLHGNIPGSYPFNRYRRCQWELTIVNTKDTRLTANAEDSFSEISGSLQRTLNHSPSVGVSDQRLQQGMILNRDWGNSPGSSCELLEGWEDDDKALGSTGPMSGRDEPRLGNTKLFGFPGLIFEVLNNDAICCLTIY